jgi:hypothetical protein
MGRSLVVSYCITMLKRAFCQSRSVRGDVRMFRSEARHIQSSNCERAFKLGTTTGFLHLLWELAHLLGCACASEEMDADAIP